FSFFLLVSPYGETMEKRKTVVERNVIPAVEWVRQLAEETAAFEVARVIEAESKRGDGRRMVWDYVITLSVKPDDRHVDLFVETRQELSPKRVLGDFEKL